MKNNYAQRLVIAACALAASALSALPAAALAAEPQINRDNPVVMNFVDAEIKSVIRAVGLYTGTTFVIDPRVSGTLNLVSEKALTQHQAYDLLAATLRQQGFAIVSADGFVKVMPEAEAKLQAGSRKAGFRGDQIATRVFSLNYENAANLVPVLRPLISPNNTINADAGNNTLVVTDYADNLGRIAGLIATLDVPNTSNIDVLPIRYGIASDVATMVNKLLDTGPGGPAGGDGGRTSVMADLRTNAVVVRASSAARANMARGLIAKLDQPTSLPGNIHVVYLKNADAVKLAQTLRSIIGFDASGTAPNAAVSLRTASPAGGAGLLQTGAGNQQAAAAPPAYAPAAGAQNPGGGAAGFIQADANTNTLIITASDAVYRNLRGVIDELDMRRSQVYVESLIVEVSEDLGAELGVQWLGLSGNSSSAYRVGGVTSFGSGGNNIVAQAVAQQAGAPVAPGNGLTIGIFRQIAGKLGLGALAHALETSDQANVLSVPNLMTLDNEEARIIVGQNVPFITGSYGTPGTGAGVNPFQTIERKDVGLALSVRPQISEGGTVRMQIYQEVSSVDNTQNNPAGLITNKRSIETNVVVDDGEIIVLGGLIQEQSADGTEAVPVLSRIPFFGNLFKNRTGTRKKTNLMVFLRPTVIRSQHDNNNVVADRYDYIRGENALEGPKDSLLPNRTRSLPALNEGSAIGNVLDGALGGALIDLRKAKDAGRAAHPESTAPPAVETRPAIGP